jgi:hypothetical protein
MWKIALAFIVFAGLALFILSRGGDIDMSGENHNISAPHGADHAASAPAAAASAASAPAAPAAPAASAAK